MLLPRIYVSNLSDFVSMDPLEIVLYLRTKGAFSKSKLFRHYPRHLDLRI